MLLYVDFRITVNQNYWAGEATHGSESSKKMHILQLLRRRQLCEMNGFELLVMCNLKTITCKRSEVLQTSSQPLKILQCIKSLTNTLSIACKDTTTQCIQELRDLECML